jgi:quinol monooxygenase YgiN
MAMPMYALTRYEVRAEARDAAERAMHEHASFVRRELPDVSWTVYRDPVAPTRYTALVRSDDRAAEERHRKMFAAAFASYLVGEPEVSGAELVTSSDLQRRHRQ